ncbi:MAG: hypothetical protein K2H74_07010 [Paramuribaculum sp.]|nr:hypothetical protein [Paramuribaculum sp.]
MKKDMIFFSPDGQGLTSTSANHVANLAKEMIRGIETSLSALTFYSTEVSLIGNTSTDKLSHGSDLSELETVIGKLHSVAKAKSLIAWLREAIKAKERLIEEVEDITFDDYCKIAGIDIPKYPERGESLTDDEYYASLTLAERNRYYETETLAAVLGKAIHPDGSFASAREALNEHIQKPRDVKGDGRDTLIFSYVPTVDSTNVDEVYFTLQKQYREAQAKVNAYKYDCEKAVKTSRIAVDTKHAEQLDEYNHRRELISAQMTAYKHKRTAEIGDYRIVIPDSLREIYETVSHLGKQ